MHMEEWSTRWLRQPLQIGVYPRQQFTHIYRIARFFHHLTPIFGFFWYRCGHVAHTIFHFALFGALPCSSIHICITASTAKSSSWYSRWA